MSTYSVSHIHTQVGSSLKESRRVIGRPHAGQRSALDVLYPMPTHDSLFFAGKNLVVCAVAIFCSQDPSCRSEVCTRHQNSVLLGQHASVELASVNNKVD